VARAVRLASGVVLVGFELLLSGAAVSTVSE
jgi:hypothetical protein